MWVLESIGWYNKTFPDLANLRQLWDIPVWQISTNRDKMKELDQVEHVLAGLFTVRCLDFVNFLQWVDVKNLPRTVILTLKGPIPYIYGTQVWLSLCLQMS